MTALSWPLKLPVWHRAAPQRVTLAGFARRVVNGAVAALVTVTVAATAVGFWLSYAGLHDFAVRNGLHGAEAWAWPASVDLFILAGELGITISAIQRRRDPLAWVYLAAGFGPSVMFNVLHVSAVDVSWGPYAVAAVPPVAAMLALAALMRQVFRLAVITHVAPDDSADGKVPSDVIEAAKASMRATVAAGNPLSANQLAERFSLTRAVATKTHRDVLAESNGEPSGQS